MHSVRAGQDVVHTHVGQHRPDPVPIDLHRTTHGRFFFLSPFGRIRGIDLPGTHHRAAPQIGPGLVALHRVIIVVGVTLQHERRQGIGRVEDSLPIGKIRQRVGRHRVVCSCHDTEVLDVAAARTVFKQQMRKRGPQSFLNLIVPHGRPVTGVGAIVMPMAGLRAARGNRSAVVLEVVQFVFAYQPLRLLLFPLARLGVGQADLSAVERSRLPIGRVFRIEPFRMAGRSAHT